MTDLRTALDSGFLRRVAEGCGLSEGDRLACERVASRLHVQHIASQGAPYLERYFVSGWAPHNRIRGPGLFLHHFVASDSRTLHNHPWRRALSLVLVGGYEQERRLPDGSTERRRFLPGDHNAFGHDDYHRVQLLEADAWTLLLVDGYAGRWGFE